MTLFLKTAILIICFINFSMTAIKSAENEILKINECLYVQTKEAYYTTPSYESMHKHNLYFVFEKQASFVSSDWDSYIRYQRHGINDKKNEYQLRCTKIKEGVKGFSNSLKLFSSLCAQSGGTRTTEMWIAYITTENRIESKKKPYFPSKNDLVIAKYTNEKIKSDVEMAVPVFLNPHSPITTHLGIFRGFEYFDEEIPTHRRISMQLHGFAAAASNLIYGNKVYMVTKPVGGMPVIMKETFRFDENSLYIGDEKERREKLEKPENTCSDFIPTDLLQPAPLTNLDDTNWKITKPDGEVESFQKPDWFEHTDLSHETGTTFMIDIKKLALICYK